MFSQPVYLLDIDIDLFVESLDVFDEAELSSLSLDDLVLTFADVIAEFLFLLVDEDDSFVFLVQLLLNIEDMLLQLLILCLKLMNV